jgi:hypothetical protein
LTTKWRRFSDHCRFSAPSVPYLRSVRATDRGTEFKQRCKGLGIKGVTLHSYRYAWAERAKTAGYPERFAQEALGHNSKAVHRAYARKAKVELPSLGDYERQQKLLEPGPKKDRHCAGMNNMPRRFIWPTIQLARYFAQFAGLTI